MDLFLDMMNSPGVWLQQAGNDDNWSGLNKQLEWSEGFPKGKYRSESMIHFVVATSICLLSSPKYARAVLDVWRQPGIYRYNFFGNPTVPHSLAGNWYLFGRSLAPSYSNFPTSIHHQLLFSLSNFETMSIFNYRES